MPGFFFPDKVCVSNIFKERKYYYGGTSANENVKQKQKV